MPMGSIAGPKTRLATIILKGERLGIKFATKRMGTRSFIARVQTCPECGQMFARIRKQEYVLERIVPRLYEATGVHSHVKEEKRSA